MCSGCSASLLCLCADRAASCSARWRSAEQLREFVYWRRQAQSARARMQEKTTRLLQHAKKLYHEYHSLAINFQSGVNRFRHEHSTPDRFHVPSQPGKPGPDPAHLQPTETGDFTNEYDQWELENVAAASGTPRVIHTASGRDAAAKKRAADPTDSDSDLVSESDELPPARTTDFAQTAPAARGAKPAWAQCAARWTLVRSCSTAERTLWWNRWRWRLAWTRGWLGHKRVAGEMRPRMMELVGMQINLLDIA